MYFGPKKNALSGIELIKTFPAIYPEFIYTQLLSARDEEARNAILRKWRDEAALNHIEDYLPDEARREYDSAVGDEGKRLVLQNVYRQNAFARAAAEQDLTAAIMKRLGTLYPKQFPSVGHVLLWLLFSMPVFGAIAAALSLYFGVSPAIKDVATTLSATCGGVIFSSTCLLVAEKRLRNTARSILGTNDSTAAAETPVAEPAIGPTSDLGVIPTASRGVRFSNTLVDRGSLRQSSSIESVPSTRQTRSLST